MKIKRYVAVLLAILLLAFPMTVFAKELGMLTISGPGIHGEFSLDNPEQLNKLMDAGFLDQDNMISKAPENLGEGYTITAHLNLDGKLTPFVKFVYYPVAQGEPGYVNYIGRLDGISLRTINEWGKLSFSADNAFREVMTANSITLQSAVTAAPAVKVAVPETKPEVQPNATSPVVKPIPYIAVTSIAVVLALLGAAVLIRRRAADQRSA
jgi:hypothetical protein